MRAGMYWCGPGVFAIGLLIVLPTEGQPSTPGPTCQQPTPSFGCNCHSAGGEEGDQCEWKRVFKAVRGSGRGVRTDFLSGGAINEGVPYAKKISTELPYRDARILDNWYKLDIEKVKVEVFKDNVRESWFLFNGLTSTIETWFSKERLIASPYTNIRDIPDDEIGALWSINGSDVSVRRFYINRNYGGCLKDCGYLAVVDGESECDWGKMDNKPYFLYGKKEGSCSKSQHPGETGVGNRFVISVLVCYP